MLGPTGLDRYRGQPIDAAGLRALFPDLEIGERTVGDYDFVTAARGGMPLFYLDGTTLYAVDPAVATPWPKVRVGATYNQLDAELGALRCVGAEAMEGGILCTATRAPRFAFFFPGGYSIGVAMPTAMARELLGSQTVVAIAWE